MTKSVYIESSAVLSWLLGESRSKDVISLLNDADNIVTSVITLIEIERALVRAEHCKDITSGQAMNVLGFFKRASSGWTLMEIIETVKNRASRPFPVEPVRTLDAIHLATSLEFLQLFPELTVLSFDRRILDNIEPLGLLPAM